MCGIIGLFDTNENEESVNKEVLDQFEDQKSRGMEGFGIVSIDEKKHLSLLRACEPYKFILDLYNKKSKMLMVHHRTPTSSPNWLGQTHPIFVSNVCLAFDYFVIHNGVISNSEFLRKKHEEEHHFQYTTLFTNNQSLEKFNDSESLAIELALYIENIQKAIRTQGSAAFMIIQVDKKKGTALKVFFGRNERSQLNLAASRGRRFISSEGPGNEIKANVLYSFKPEGEMKLQNRPLIFKPEYQAYVPYKTPLKVTTSFNNNKVEGFRDKNAKSDLALVKGTNPWHEEDDFQSTSKEEIIQDEFDESDTFSGPNAQEYEEIFEDTTSEIESIILDFFEAAQQPETFTLADPRTHADRVAEIFKEASRRIQNIHDTNDLANGYNTINNTRLDEEVGLFEELEEQKEITTPTIFHK